MGWIPYFFRKTSVFFLHQFLPNIGEVSFVSREMHLPPDSIRFRKLDHFQGLPRPERGGTGRQAYSSASSARAESFFRWVMMGTTNRSTATIRKPREMGRVTKMEKSPCDNMRD